MVSKKITMSDTSFYQKIMSKYQKGKNNVLNFPFMVFGKNLEHILPKKFNINLLLQLHFHNQKIINYAINKNIKGMIKWVSGIEKIFTGFVYRPNILKTINDTKKSMTFQHEIISGFPAAIPNELTYNYSLSYLSNISVRRRHEFIYEPVGLNSPQNSQRTQRMQSEATKSLRPLQLEILYYPSRSVDINSNQIANHFLMNYGSISAGKMNNNMLSSGLVDHSSHLLSYRNLFYKRILQNINSSKSELESINSSKSELESKSVQYNLSNKENIVRYSGLVDHSSHLLSYRNLFLNKILQNIAFNPRNITSSSDVLFNQIQIYGNNSQIGKIRHETILHDFGATGKYYTSQNQNVTKKDDLKNSSNSSGSISMQRRDGQNNDNFYFQNHRQIDQKIEQIKKLSQEAKEIVAQKSLRSSVKSEIQPEIDIKRLSEKVYKMIEYNLKIEKERRGYL
ncbi:hypothetical protein METP3_00359 [Methanosarcinales archaeon]|nr:hypothetical protein METP3_00359 [Methanosarcinales archaeon]